MKIIRTKAIELTTIPAIAFKQKLRAGGAGITILHLEEDAKAVATIDKRSGEPVPFGNYNEEVFNAEVFEEALELTSGLPYAAMAKIKLIASAPAETDDICCETEAETASMPAMCGSDEYKALIERYSDEKGIMNFALMNRDFMNFAGKSKVVSDMVAASATSDDIVLFVLKNRAAFFAAKKEHITDAEAQSLSDTLNEINPRSAFKDLKAYVIRVQSKSKRR